MRQKSVSRYKFNQILEIMNYSELREKVERGARFTIDFKKRTLRVNGKEVEITDDKEVENIIASWGDDLMFSIENLYQIYKVSVPSERSEKHQHNYFKALPYEKLTDWQMMYGMRRELAKFNLEYVILKAIIMGALTWHDEWGTWFWQSDTDKDLVILREWIEPQAA